MLPATIMDPLHQFIQTFFPEQTPLLTEAVATIPPTPGLHTWMTNLLTNSLTRSLQMEQGILYQYLEAVLMAQEEQSPVVCEAHFEQAHRRHTLSRQLLADARRETSTPPPATLHQLPQGKDRQRRLARKRQRAARRRQRHS